MWVEQRDMLRGLCASATSIHNSTTMNANRETVIESQKQSASDSTQVIPIFLFGTEKLAKAGSAIGAIRSSRNSLASDGIYISVIGILDSNLIGSVSPEKRLRPDQVLQVGGGIPDNLLEHIEALKDSGTPLRQEPGYHQRKDKIPVAVSLHCLASSTVVLDLMPEDSEEEIKEALFTLGQFGACVISLVKRSAEFTAQMEDVYGNRYLYVDSCTTDSLVSTIVAMYAFGWKDVKLPAEFASLRVAREHVHGPNCNHGSEEQAGETFPRHPVDPHRTEGHVHGPGCNHSHGDAHGHSEHVHGPGCNHSHEDPHGHERSHIEEHVHGPGCNHVQEEVDPAVEELRLMVFRGNPEHGPNRGNQHGTVNRSL
jgi:hypothetical protein